MLLFIVAFIAVGLFAGVCAGLLGISGGVITIPLLILIFNYMPSPPEQLMHVAIGTSFACMLFNAFASMHAHKRRDNINWKVVRGFSSGILVSVIMGSYIAHTLQSRILEVIFGLFECLVAFYFLIPRSAKHQTFRPPPFILCFAVGGLIGFVSSVLGIGGGMIAVPVLMAMGMQTKKAIGTSAGTVLITTTLGATSYLLFGMSAPQQAHTLGYIYLPAFLPLSLATLIGAPIGSKLASILPSHILRALFSTVLFITGLIVIFQ